MNKYRLFTVLYLFAVAVLLIISAVSAGVKFLAWWRVAFG